jgi:hypothetical protein
MALSWVYGTSKPVRIETAGDRVPASVLYMSMSLDGYIAAPNDEPGNRGGDGFGRLHEWGVAPDGKGFRTDGPARELMDAIVRVTDTPEATHIRYQIHR